LTPALSSNTAAIAAQGERGISDREFEGLKERSTPARSDERVDPPPLVTAVDPLGDAAFFSCNPDRKFRLRPDENGRGLWLIRAVSGAFLRLYTTGLTHRIPKTDEAVAAAWFDAFDPDAAATWPNRRARRVQKAKAGGWR
jgi:hypothetical protein